MSGIHRTVQKYSPLRKIVGKDTFDKAHFLGTAAVKQSDAKHEAKKAAKSAEDLATEQRAAQKVALAELDDEENRRIKKILSASRGTRGYRGGPMFRGRATNSAGSSAPSRVASAVPAGLSPSSAAMRAGGARGGLGRSLLD